MSEKHINTQFITRFNFKSVIQRSITIPVSIEESQIINNVLKHNLQHLYTNSFEGKHYPDGQNEDIYFFNTQ